MKMIINSCVSIGAVLCMAALSLAQAPEMPKPTKEHELLSQFAGDWQMTAEIAAAPGQEPFKCEGRELSKMLSGFWLIGQGESNMGETPMKSLLTIGYDPEAKKYVGTFLCTEDSTLWIYKGTMDESGKKLTLETTGPTMLDRSKRAKYRETLELKDKDHKVFTSFMQTDDGEWEKIVTMDYRRKK